MQIIRAYGLTDETNCTQDPARTNVM